MTVDHDMPFRQAEAWIAANVPPRPACSSMTPSGSTWSSAATGPARSSGSTSWTPTATSPAATPRGWREFDYLISTATLRSFPDDLPQVVETQRHSRVVATFGRGIERVEIRKVQGSPV